MRDGRMTGEKGIGSPIDVTTKCDSSPGRQPKTIGERSGFQSDILAIRITAYTKQKRCALSDASPCLILRIEA